MDPEKINSPTHQRTMFETGQSLFENSPLNTPMYLHYSNLASSYQAFGSPLFPSHFNLHSMFGSVGSLSTAVSSPCTSTSGAAWWPMSSRLLAPDYLTCSLAASTSSTAFGNVNHDLVFSGFDIFTHQMHPELCKTAEGKVSKRKSSSHSSSKNSSLATNKLCSTPVYTNPLTGVTITPINIDDKVTSTNSKPRRSAFSLSIPPDQGVPNDKIVHTNSHIMPTGMHNLPVTITSKNVHSTIDSMGSKSSKSRKVMKRTSKPAQDVTKQDEKNSSSANLLELNNNGSESNDSIEEELHSSLKVHKVENSSKKSTLSEQNDVGSVHSISPMLTPPSLEPTAEIHSGPLNLSTKTQNCLEDSLQPPILVPVVPPKQKKNKPKNSLKHTEHSNKQELSAVYLGQKQLPSEQQQNITSQKESQHNPSSEYGNHSDSSYLSFKQRMKTSSVSSVPQVTLSPSTQSHTKTSSPNMITVKAIPSSSKGISLLTGAPAMLNLLPDMVVSPSKSPRNSSVFVNSPKKVMLNENSNVSQTAHSSKGYLVNSLLSKSGDSTEENFSKSFDPNDHESNVKELAIKFRSVDDETSADDTSEDESSDESNSSSQSESSSTNSESDSETSDSENTEKSIMNSSRGSTPMSLMLTTNKRPSYDNSGSSSPVKRRRIIMDEKELRIPLEHGWRRQTKIRAFSYSGVRGTVLYFGPCGRKLKTYPEVIRYLDKNKITDISRENFSFSTKVNIGEFLEPVDDANEFVHLNELEVIARIAEIRSRKRRRSSANKIDERKNVESPKCPLKDTKLQRKYDQQEMARRVQEIKLQKKIEREQALTAAKEAKKLKVIEDKRQKEQLRLLRQKEKHEKQEQLRLEKEIRAQQMVEARRKRQEELEKQRLEEAVRKAKEKELKRQQAVMIKEQELQKRREMLIMVDLERERRRQHMLLVKALEAHKKQEERERIKEERKAAKKLNRERKLEQRRLELQFLREMKKPVEDMEIRDAEALPTLNRIPGVKLPGKAFADLLMVIEFLHNFGEVLGFDMNNLPSINTLQMALLNDEDAEEELVSTIHHLLTCAIDDPGTITNTKHLNILNQALKDIDITGYTVSEVLRIFVHAQLGEENPMTCWLKEHNFLALNPSQKASILAFICNELLCSKTICRQIENNIESVNNIRRDKWMVEGKLRKLKTVFGRKQLQTLNEPNEESKSGSGKSHEQLKLSTSTPEVKEAEDDEESGNESETSTGTGQRDPDPDEQDEENGMSADELKKQIDKLNKQLNQCRNKLIKANHQLRAVSFGQDRFKRRYWVLPYSGGIFIEGMESSEFPEELCSSLNAEEMVIKTEPCDVKSSVNENTYVDNSVNTSEVKDFNANDKKLCSIDVDSKLNNSTKIEDNLFLQKPEDLGKLSDYIHDSVTSSSPSSSGKKPCGSIRFPNVGVNNTVIFNGLNNFNAKETNGSHPNCAKCDNSIQNGNCNSSFSFCPSFCVENYRTNEKITQKPWFSLLPRMPCDETSLTRTRASSKSSANQNLSKHYLPYSAFNIYNNNVPSFATLQMGVINGSPSSLLLNHPSLAVPNSSVSSPVTPGSPSAGSLGQGSGVETPNKFSLKSETTLNLPNMTIDHSSLLEKLHQHAEAQPIPLELQRGWWRITDPNQLRLCMKNFHQRGIRERMLYKQFEKYEDFACNACGKGNEDVADLDITELDRKISQLPGGAPEENDPDEWLPEVELRVEMALLEHIEHLEDRIINSSMQVKNWKRSPKASTDKTSKFRPSCLQTKENSEMGYLSPLEVSRNRLLMLESNVERRYIKPPLGNSTSELKFPSANSRDASDDHSSPSEEEPLPALLQWRDSIAQVTTSAQLAICCNLLENCIAWDKSVMKASCQICNSGDNEAMLLLCDGCDKGYHTYCFKPKMETIPDGDWYCNECLNKASGERVCLVCGKKGKNLCICDNCPKAYHTDCLEPPVTRSPKGKWLCSHCEQKPSKIKSSGGSNTNSSGSNNSNKKKKKKKKPENCNTPSTKAEKKQEKQNSAEKKNPERSKDKNKINRDFSPCRKLLQEMEEHEDAWPFLLPVNTKQFPSYRKVIKKPMDLSIIKNKLQEESYKSREDFALDIRLIFDNCETFNEDDSPVGKAGHSMRAFFETRWEELVTN